MLAARQHIYEEEYDSYIDPEDLYTVETDAYGYARVAPPARVKPARAGIKSRSRPRPKPRAGQKVQPAKAKLTKEQRKAAAAALRKSVATVAGRTLAVMVLFALGALLLLRYEKLTATNAEVNALKYEIKQYKSDIEDQKIQIEFAMDITTANVIASTELNMGYPGTDDVVTKDALPQAEKTQQGPDADGSSQTAPENGGQDGEGAHID